MTETALSPLDRWLVAAVRGTPLESCETAKLALFTAPPDGGMTNAEPLVFGPFAGGAVVHGVELVCPQTGQEWFSPFRLRPDNAPTD